MAKENKTTHNGAPEFYGWDEPVQLRLFPPTREAFYDYIRYLMGLFLSVTILNSGTGDLGDGILIDVYCDGPNDCKEAISRLRRSSLVFELPNDLI